MNKADTRSVNNKPIKKKSKSVSLDKKKAGAGWWFVLPFVIGFVFVYLPMIIDSIWYSFNEMKILSSGDLSLTFVGFQNYIKAFQYTEFTNNLYSGIVTLIFEIPAIVIFSLFVAIVLNQKIIGRAAFRAIFFIPVILATGLINDIDTNLIDYMGSTDSIDTGAGSNQVSEIVSAMDIERLFSGMAIGTGMVEKVTTLVNNIYDIINRCGVQMLIFLSGLQSISPAIYESCSIDGASAWETFWKITFPMISPMILVNGVYTIIDSFTASSNTMMTYIDSIYSGGSEGQVVSSAMSWVYFLVIILIVAIVGLIFRTFVFYQRRD